MWVLVNLANVFTLVNASDKIEKKQNYSNNLVFTFSQSWINFTNVLQK